MSYDVAAIRAKLRSQMSGKFSDPDEFRPIKVDDGKTQDYRFFILPPTMVGDILKSGKVTKGMDMFYVQHANHWIHDKPHPCPRIWMEIDCPICQKGFDDLKEEKNKPNEARRAQIIKEFMPNSYYMVNIFFTTDKCNPEDLRGRVKFYNAPKTCFDLWTEALLREELGDSEDPKAYGAFFDENNAFKFQLSVTRQGRNNSYRTSKFLAADGKPIPISNKPENITKILALRHDLFAKIEEPNLDKLNKVYAMLVHGDDNPEQGGFDVDETKSPPTSVNITEDVDYVDYSSVDEVVDDSPAEAGLVDEVVTITSAKGSSSDDEEDAELDALLSQISDDD